MLPVLLLAPVVNYSVDPAHLFEKTGEQEALIAEQLLAGKNVSGFELYNDRLIARYLLERRTERPNVLILGSSRTLNMGSYLFPRSRVVNGSMLASTVREVLAAYQIVHSRGLHPDTVVVGVDAWMLNADAYDERWTAIKPQFDSALRTFGISEWPGRTSTNESQSRLGALFSADYFQQSIKSLRGSEPKPKWTVSDSNLNVGFTRTPDGSYTYSLAERTKTADEVEAKAAKYTSGTVYMLGEYAKVDSTHVRAITALLQLIRQDGSQPILFLTPYHPSVYGKLAADPRYRIVIESEAVLREVAKRLAVPVVGSYDPGAVGLSSADFYDGHHLRETGMVKLFSN